MSESVERVRTGIEGLDNMLCGGFIPRRPYVVSGPPGSGKTTLCLHFLLEGLKRGECVIYVAIDEPPNEVKTNAESFGWDLGDTKILDATPDVSQFKKTPSIIDVGTVLDVKDMKDIMDIRMSQMLRLREVSVHSVQKMLGQEFRFHEAQGGSKYTRCVIDSLAALKLFSMKGEDWKRHIQSFFKFLSEMETTTLVVAEERPDVIDSEFLLARGHVRLYRWRRKATDEVRRAVSVEKLRASSFDEHVRALCIDDSGLNVGSEALKLFETRKARALPQVKEPKNAGCQRLQFGIEELDRMLNGGLIPRRPYLITGPPGSGKTSLAIQFLLHGIAQDEGRMLYVALEEPPNEVRMNMESYGWDLGGLDVIDAVPDIMKPEPTPIMEISSESLVKGMCTIPYDVRKSSETRTFEVNIHSLMNKMRQVFQGGKFDRVVIDSLTALEYFCMEDFELFTGVHSFLRFLSESRVTTLLTAEIPETGKVGFESLLTRGELRLHKFRHADRLWRGISVEKYRGSPHDDHMRPMRITEKGLVI